MPPGEIAQCHLPNEPEFNQVSKHSSQLEDNTEDRRTY